MHLRTRLACGALVGIFTALAIALGRAPEQGPERAEAAKSSRRLLPGVQADGAIQMPNQWSLRPAGKQVELGDFPVNLAVHPSGKWLAALHAGYGDHEVIIVN